MRSSKTMPRQDFESFLLQKGYLSPDGSLKLDEPRAARGEGSGKVFEEFKFGLATMAVVVLVLVTVFWGQRGSGAFQKNDRSINGGNGKDEQMVIEERIKQVLTDARTSVAPVEAKRNRNPIPIVAPSPVRRVTSGSGAGARQSETAATTGRMTKSRREFTLYKVQTGDILERIARRHYGQGKYWREIAKANGIRRPEALRVGQTIKLPALQVPMAPPARRARAITPAPVPIRQRTAPRPQPFDPFELTGGRTPSI